MWMRRNWYPIKCSMNFNFDNYLFADACMMYFNDNYQSISKTTMSYQFNQWHKFTQFAFRKHSELDPTQMSLIQFHLFFFGCFLFFVFTSRFHCTRHTEFDVCAKCKEIFRGIVSYYIPVSECLTNQMLSIFILKNEILMEKWNSARARRSEYIQWHLNFQTSFRVCHFIRR